MISPHLHVFNQFCDKHNVAFVPKKQFANYIAFFCMCSKSIQN